MRSESIEEALTSTHGAHGWRADVEYVLGAHARVSVACEWGRSEYITGAGSEDVARAAFAAGEDAMAGRVDTDADGAAA